MLLVKKYHVRYIHLFQLNAKCNEMLQKYKFTSQIREFIKNSATQTQDMLIITIIL